MVRNMVSPINTWLGGDVCVPKADLVKCITIIILVKLVSMTSIAGRNDIRVSIKRILNAPLSDPLPFS